MLLFSLAKPLPELSTFFAEGLNDCRDVVINKLVLSFEASRGEQMKEKHASEDVKMAPGLDTASNLREDCFARVLALIPTVLSFLSITRSGEKNSRSFTSCSRRTPEGSFACQKQNYNTSELQKGTHDKFSCSATISTSTENNHIHDG